jgi:hypothetical protein
MKIRRVHAAALALAGWYLMMPPMTGDKLLEHAPLSQWQIAARFDSAAECAAKKKEFASQSQTLINDASASVQRLARAESLARCVDSADPRLKGN